MSLSSDSPRRTGVGEPGPGPGLEPIGFVRSSLADCREVPPWGAPAEIHVFPPYEPGLLGIERSSHVLVIGYFHRADRGRLLSRPRVLAPEAPPLGVFACRSPARPNPLSLTVSRLLGRHGPVLWLDRLDLVDQTPILDLKPYNPGWDDAFCATRQRRVQPRVLNDEQLFACLERALLAHLGDLADQPEARLGLGAVFVAVRTFGTDPRDPTLGAIVPRLDLTADAIQGLLGATFASGRIRVATDEPPGTLRFETPLQGPILLRARPGALEPWPLDPARLADGFDIECRGSAVHGGR